MSSSMRKAYAYAALAEPPTSKQKSGEVISFSDTNVEGIKMLYDDALIVFITIIKFLCKKDYGR